MNPAKRKKSYRLLREGLLWLACAAIVIIVIGYFIIGALAGK